MGNDMRYLFKGVNFIGEWVEGNLVLKTTEGNYYNYFPNCDTIGHIINIGDYYIIDEDGDAFWVDPKTVRQCVIYWDSFECGIRKNDCTITSTIIHNPSYKINKSCIYEVVRSIHDKEKK